MSRELNEPEPRRGGQLTRLWLSAAGACGLAWSDTVWGEGGWGEVW